MQVDKENIKVLYAYVMDELHDIINAVKEINADNQCQVLGIVEDRVNNTKYLMNRVYNPMIQHLKDSGKIAYSMYEKFKTIDAAVAAAHYKEYLEKKQLIEAYENGDITFD